MSDNTFSVLDDVHGERIAQDAKWGPQHHPAGTGGILSRNTANHHRRLCDEAAQNGTLTWRHILDEEVAEAYAETDPTKLRAELVQVAAVAVAWIEDLDRSQ